VLVAIAVVAVFAALVLRVLLGAWNARHHATYIPVAKVPDAARTAAADSI
jgi:hypothetical protein